MKTYIATLALLGGMACADNVRYRGETVQIKFDEPVVPQSACHNGWNDAASDADKGLDLFDVTGDDQHKPKMRWVDQDLLQIEFVEGTSCATEYRLSFRPGCGKYLGQGEMPRTSFTFSHPKTGLDSYSVPGLDEGAVVVLPRSSKTKEEQEFPQVDGVGFSYQQIIEKEYTAANGVKRFKREIGATIPATVAPAQLKHGLNQRIMERWAATKTDWAALTLESPLPQALLVQPQSPLPSGTKWEIVSNENMGFRGGQLSQIHNVDHDLATAANAGYDAKTRELNVTVAFGALVTLEEAERAWREMVVSVGGTKAVATEDGKAKTLTVNGKECRISLVKMGLSKLGTGTPGPYPRRVEAGNAGEEEHPRPAFYVPQGVTDGFLLKVEGQTPAVMDFEVPQGIVTALGGRKTLSPKRHRLSLNPGWPVLAGVQAPYLATVPWRSEISLLPLKGGHKLRVPMVNTDALSAVAYRVPGAMVATEADKLSTAVEGDSTSQRIVHLQVTLERHAKKVEELDPKDLAEIQTELALLRNKEQNPVAHALAAKLKASQELQVEVPQGDNANLATVESVLDMDALLGGQAAPGIYLVRLRSHATPAVRQTLSELKLPEDVLDLERYALVQITDLNVATDDDSLKVVLVSHLSDGTPVLDAKVTPYVSEEKKKLFGRNRDLVMVKKADATPVENGCMSMVPVFGEGDGMCCALVECGDDYAVVGRGYGIWTAHKPQPEQRALLQTDRDLYRPGETVHVRGIFRQLDVEGVASVPRSASPATFRVRRPDGKDLVNKQVMLDASGGIDESFTLPDGEEDVTGSYRIELTSADRQYRASTSVQAEVFRRDSFKLSSTLTADPIAPKEFTYTLEAKDFNGTPVANGKATLDISVPVPLLTFQGEKCPAQDLPADAKGHHPVVIHREFRLDDKGKLELKGTFAPFLPRDCGGINISGSVANDREEYVCARGIYKGLYAADFVPVFSTSTGCLTLSAVETQGDSVRTVNPLAREQKVHMAIHYTAKETQTLPNGFVFQTTKPAVLREEDITVPADCHEGVVWDARKMWNEFTEANPDSGGSATVIITGTDPEGRTVEKESTIYSWDRGNDRRKVQAAGEDTCKLGGDGMLHVTTTFLREGTASFVVACNDKVRTVVQPVKAGTQEIVLPTVPTEEGRASVTAFLMHPDEDGVFSRYETHSCDVTLPMVKYVLQTQVNVPKEPVLPGSQLHLDGQVTKDGKGVPATVTLFAVDEGMLTVSGYSVEDLASYFTQRRNRLYFDLETNVVRADASPRERRYAGLMESGMIPGIWSGSGLHSYTRYGSYGSADRSMKVAARRSAVNAAPCAGAMADEDCIEMDCCAAECAPAPAPQAVQVSAKAEVGNAPVAPIVPCCVSGTEEDCDDDENGEDGGAAAPRLRVNFQPVAVWQGVLKTDAEGRFSTDVALPDTLTTYKVYALVLGDDGATFGNAEESFTVNQPIMLTPGTPLFMSTGDTLRLPLTVTNNSDNDGTWTVTISSAKEPQKVTVKAHATATVYFDFTAVEEGTATLDWTAVGDKASDAVQGSFPVRFPAPLLKEAHHLVIAPGQEKKLAELLAPELATSSRGEAEVWMSANPLLHLVGCMDYLLEYPYGCTEQTASGLLPWLFYDRLAPLSPMLAETPADKVHEVIAKSVETIFKRQNKDGGLGYWGDSRESCGWASAHAALVFTIAIEQGQGACIPKDKMEALRTYLRGFLAELRKDAARWDSTGPMTLFALGRVLGDEALIDEALGLAGKENEDRRTWGCFWHRDIGADLTLIRALRKDPAKKHDAFLQWMRARGHDYRHTTTLRSGWMLIALHEYLRITPASSKEATVQLQDGTVMTLNQGVTIIKPQAKPLSTLPTVLKAVQGEVYVTFKAKAQPNQTEYPGVVEKGLQITRIYEKKGADGIWREAKEFSTGDVVRVTLTCAKSDRDLEYFVLEDYLPSCMEAINPNVPSQAAGLSWAPWSHWFDHKEYLADRVRGFCTRWCGRDLLNMTYYARVKRSGTTMAPPAQAQLMYEPQTYGLSPNTRIQSK